MTTKCTWCNRAYHYVSKHDKLCNQCFAKYVEKREFIDQQKGLPPDDTTEEEIWAMCFPNDPRAQEIMDARIKRVTQQIQDNWTEEQRLSRAVQKKTTPTVSSESVRWAKARVTSMPSSNSSPISGILE